MEDRPLSHRNTTFLTVRYAKSYIKKTSGVPLPRVASKQGGENDYSFYVLSEAHNALPQVIWIFNAGGSWLK